LNTNLHSTSSESQSMRIASYVYICTVIREMYIFCENYISCSEKTKTKVKQVRETCRKLALQLKKYIFVCVWGGGGHITQF
jgi:hypothetical protein